jgi:ribosomal protein S1
VDQKRKSADALNPLLAFVEFVAHHPVGSPVDASVESFSSHGAYVVADGVRCYVPLRFLGKPAPRSAREVLALGENRSFTVVSIAAGRRGVDLALPGFEPEGVTVTEAPPAKRKVATKKAKATAKTDKAAEKAPAAAKADTKRAATKKAATKKATPKKAAASKAAVSKEAPPKEAAPFRSETKKAVAKRAAPKKSAAKAAAAKKSAASA